jgi:hypothetical protein
MIFLLPLGVFSIFKDRPVFVPPEAACRTTPEFYTATHEAFLFLFFNLHLNKLPSSINIISARQKY